MSDSSLAGAETPQTNAGFFASMVKVMVRHRNAANLFMIFAIAMGIYGMNQVNRQFFPDFEVEVVSVSIVWPGASAEDVDLNIVDPLQSSLRLVEGHRIFPPHHRTASPFSTLNLRPNGTCQRQIGCRVRCRPDYDPAEGNWAPDHSAICPL